MDDVLGFLEGTRPFGALDGDSQLFIDQLVRVQKERGVPPARVRADRRYGANGVLETVTSMAAAVSGTESRWVPSTELAEHLEIDDGLREWLGAVARLSALRRSDVATALVRQWFNMQVFGRPFPPSGDLVELSVDDGEPVYRVVRSSIPTLGGFAGELVSILCAKHGGHVSGEAVGRVQIDLMDLVLFVGVDRSDRWAGEEGVEAPTVLSALVGLELTDASEVDEVVEQFAQNASTPPELRFELLRGVGVQVWMDRPFPASGEDLDADQEIIRFLLLARELAGRLAPYENYSADATTWSDGEEESDG